MPPTVRHSVSTDWETYAASVEEDFGEPIKVDHLQAMPEVPGVFSSVFSNLKRDLAGQPQLAGENDTARLTARLGSGLRPRASNPPVAPCGDVGHSRLVPASCPAPSARRRAAYYTQNGFTNAG
jgi:hypothetical protein